MCAGEVSQRLKYLQEDWCSNFIVGKTPEWWMPTDQPLLASRVLAAADAEISAPWGQEGWTCNDVLPPGVAKSTESWPSGFGPVCFSPEPTQGWCEALQPAVRSVHLLSLLCKTSAVWRIPHWPSVNSSCCGRTQSSIMGIACNSASKSNLFV